LTRIVTTGLDLMVRHCEERSDEAIQIGAAALDCFAALAMTKEITPRA
jgi:hypothetical protein